MNKKTFAKYSKLFATVELILLSFLSSNIMELYALYTKQIEKHFQHRTADLWLKFINLQPNIYDLLKCSENLSFPLKKAIQELRVHLHL